MNHPSLKGDLTKMSEHLDAFSEFNARGKDWGTDKGERFSKPEPTPKPKPADAPREVVYPDKDFGRTHKWSPVSDRPSIEVGTKGTVFLRMKSGTSNNVPAVYALTAVDRPSATLMREDVERLQAWLSTWLEDNPA